jgi:peptide deformylase
MAILKVYKYPHETLRQKSEPVSAVDTNIQQLVADMIETMYSFPGSVGLSAPQVGQHVRVAIIDVAAKTSRDRLKVLVNPVIVHTAKNKLVREGCLSFPDYLVNVKRALKLTLHCLDEYGQPQEYEVRDLEAVAVQHEIDHLDGVLMIDRVQSLKTDLIRREGRARPLLEELDTSDKSSGDGLTGVAGEGG